jgi:hypothetical protein
VKFLFDNLVLTEDLEMSVDPKEVLRGRVPPQLKNTGILMALN